VLQLLFPWASPLSCPDYLATPDFLSLIPPRSTCFKNSSQHASLHFRCLHPLFLSPLAMLCGICVGVIQYRRGLRRVYTTLDGEYMKMHSRNLEGILENVSGLEFSHHLTFNTLTDSVSRGCRICRSLWENLSESERDRMRNFVTTAENRDLTKMSIGYRTDLGYEMRIYTTDSKMRYGLDPGQGMP
jgi:hypothetical protein